MLILQVSRMVARGPWCRSTAERTSGSSTASMTRSSRFSTTRRRRGSLVVSPTMGTLECLRVQSTPRGQSWPPVLESQTAKTTWPWGWRDPSAQVRLAAHGLELGDQRLTRLTASTRIISEEDQKVSTSKVGDLEEIQVSGCPILQMRIICGAWQWCDTISNQPSDIILPCQGYQAFPPRGVQMIGYPQPQYQQGYSPAIARQEMFLSQVITPDLTRWHHFCFNFEIRCDSLSCPGCN